MSIGLNELNILVSISFHDISGQYYRAAYEYKGVLNINSLWPTDNI